MKPKLEKIDPLFDSSFTIKQFDETDNCNTMDWHFHPEYEIVYISNGKGKRFIGDHISTFQNGDLIFLGPNLPHLGFTNDLKEQHQEVVIQLKEDFLGFDFFKKPELKAIEQLFQRARKGLSFFGDTKENIGQKLIQLAEKDKFYRLIELLVILEELAHSEDYKMLNANGLALSVGTTELDRMRIIYDYVVAHHNESTSLEKIAQEVNMTVPAFCRFFKKATNKTFTQFVNEFRISKACRLLSEEHQTIASISFECGFNNLSHFNNQFKQITGFSPSDYRKEKFSVIDSTEE